MISKVEEYLGVFGGLEDLSSGGGFITLKNGEDVLGSNIFTLIVNLASLVDINTWSSSFSWLVEKSVWEWVLARFGNIVVRKMNDLIFRDSIGLHDLEGVAGVRLMSVVVELVRSGNDDSPMIRGVSGGG